MDTDPLSGLYKKLDVSKRKADNQKRSYWKLRLAVIAKLGGKCQCGETDVTLLEVHHTIPTCKGGYKNSSGWDIMKEWKNILDGKVSAELYCRKCHVEHGHNGNTKVRND